MKQERKLGQDKERIHWNHARVLPFSARYVYFHFCLEKVETRILRSNDLRDFHFINAVQHDLHTKERSACKTAPAIVLAADALT